MSLLCGSGIVNGVTKLATHTEYIIKTDNIIVLDSILIESSAIILIDTLVR